MSAERAPDPAFVGLSSAALVRAVLDVAHVYLAHGCDPACRCHRCVATMRGLAELRYRMAVGHE